MRRSGAVAVAVGRSIGATLRRSRFALGLMWAAARWSVVATLVLVVAGGAAPTLTAWIQRSIVDGLIDRHVSESDLLLWSLALGGAGLLGAVIPHLRRPVDGTLRRRVDLVSDDRLYAAVNAIPGLARFEDPRFLDRLRLGQQAGKTGPNGFLSALFSAIQAVVSAGGFIVSLTIINPTLVVVVLATALPAVGAQFALSNRRVAVERRNSPLLRRQVFYNNLLTSIEAVKEIRLFGLGRFFRGRMHDDLRTIHRDERALELRTLWTQGGLGLLTALTTAAALVWVIREAYHGRLSVGDIALFIAALAGLQNSLSSLIGRLADMHQSLALLGNFIEVLEGGPDLPIADPAAPLAPLGRGIELRDVWFRYGPDRPWVLKGVTVSIPHGASVAIAGLNGAGKSTLVKLLCRFYDPVSGTISWDGVDIREVDPADLRQRIGVVFQDYMRYDLTIAENIGIGAVEKLADRAEIERVAATAGVADYVNATPHGYDTMLSLTFAGGPRGAAVPPTGTTLSGGQWQRLALARCLMRMDRDLLILDEPSSGLDAEAEHAIHQQLRKVRAGRTSVLVSHRFSTIREADVILVLTDGRIGESGSHAELMAAGGEYRRLFDLQAAGYLDEPAAPVVPFGRPGHIGAVAVRRS